ncbi:MAG: DUF3618 domain-containing protein [Promicromonosporaceae bacterium]|nr:DUF3618 domain-containing protein [Promicromonosporaceae bacterium]
MSDAKPTRDELNAEVIRLRAELASTVDQFSARISPSYQASRLRACTKDVLTDARTLLTGGGLPAADEGPRARNLKAALAMTGAFVALVTLRVVKASRR